MGAKIERRKILSGQARELWMAALKKRYEDGASIRQLVEWSGRSYGGVHDLLRQSGAKLRDRGGAAGAGIPRGKKGKTA